MGYAWGKTDERIEIAIKNEFERQTYYGASDYQTKEFVVRDVGNKLYTKFLRVKM